MGYILVVDDEKDIRQLIGQILSDEGYQVCLASNSEAAMDEINSKSPDLIILDIWLKDSNMDGIEILKTVRNNDKNIPIVRKGAGKSINDKQNYLKKLKFNICSESSISKLSLGITFPAATP